MTGNGVFGLGLNGLTGFSEMCVLEKKMEKKSVMEDFEENYDLECSHCGHSPIRTRDCDSCEDGIKDDLYEEDPLWYSTGE